jgi:hypothetical protein
MNPRYVSAFGLNGSPLGSYGASHGDTDLMTRFSRLHLPSLTQHEQTRRMVNINWSCLQRMLGIPKSEVFWPPFELQSRSGGESGFIKQESWNMVGMVLIIILHPM